MTDTNEHIQPISESEINERKVKNLRTRPNAPMAMGGDGKTSAQLREAFDALPLLIAGKVNEIIGSLTPADDEQYSALLDELKYKFGAEEKSIKDIIDDIFDGDFAGYLNVADEDDPKDLKEALAEKSPILSPAFTGTPTAPTPSSEDDSTKLATTAFVKAITATLRGLYDDIVAGRYGQIPPGGSAGDILKKLSNADHDIGWGALKVGTPVDDDDPVPKGYLDEIAGTLSGAGRYLSSWNCVTGMPGTFPATTPYTYETGDYFIVTNVASASGTNYKPDGTEYTGEPSEAEEEGGIYLFDMYRYDGTTWEALPFHLVLYSLIGKTNEIVATSVTEPSGGTTVRFVIPPTTFNNNTIMHLVVPSTALSRSSYSQEKKVVLYDGVAEYEIFTPNGEANLFKLQSCSVTNEYKYSLTKPSGGYNIFLFVRTENGVSSAYVMMDNISKRLPTVTFASREGIYSFGSDKIGVFVSENNFYDGGEFLIKGTQQTNITSNNAFLKRPVYLVVTGTSPQVSYPILKKYGERSSATITTDAMLGYDLLQFKRWDRSYGINDLTSFSFKVTFGKINGSLVAYVDGISCEMFVRRQPIGTGYGRVYVEAVDGSDAIVYRADAAGGTFPIRTPGGQLVAADPTDATHLVTKGFADSNYAAIGSGGSVYSHRLVITGVESYYDSGWDDLTFVIYSHSNTPITKTTLFTDAAVKACLPAAIQGTLGFGGAGVGWTIKFSGSSSLSFACWDTSTGAELEFSISASDIDTVTDTVTAI